MSAPGIGVMINALFSNGSALSIRDDGQSCCEERYMTCDDDLAGFAGARLTDVEVADGPDIEADEYTTHEQQFLRVHTDRGLFTVANRNEHNGYYGGFSIAAELVPAPGGAA